MNPLIAMTMVTPISPLAEVSVCAALSSIGISILARSTRYSVKISRESLARISRGFAVISSVLSLFVLAARAINAVRILGYPEYHGPAFIFREVAFVPIIIALVSISALAFSIATLRLTLVDVGADPKPGEHDSGLNGFQP
jgi:hypothetical protein